jgi:hypothetical protein
MLAPAGFSAALDQRSIEVEISGSEGERTLALVADSRSRRAVMSWGVILRFGAVEGAAIFVFKLVIRCILDVGKCDAGWMDGFGGWSLCCLFEVR